VQAIKPGERILFLGVPSTGELLRLAGLLSDGLIAVIGEDEAVREARKRCAHCTNVLLAPAHPEEIPFQVPFFTLVVDPDGVCERSEVARREAERVLLDGGRIVREMDG
jgi:hypothetical protein